MKSEGRSKKEESKSPKDTKKLHTIQEKTTQIHNMTYFVVQHKKFTTELGICCS
jgi:hypothetical protein